METTRRPVAPMHKGMDFPLPPIGEAHASCMPWRGNLRRQRFVSVVLAIHAVASCSVGTPRAPSVPSPEALGGSAPSSALPCASTMGARLTAPWYAPTSAPTALRRGLAPLAHGRIVMKGIVMDAWIGLCLAMISHGRNPLRQGMQRARMSVCPAVLRGFARR